MDIRELNERRIAARNRVDALGIRNTPKDYDKRLATDAQYALSYDAWMAAERDYRNALAGMTTDELIAVAG